jgi:hypothetical protein
MSLLREKNVRLRSGLAMTTYCLEGLLSRALSNVVWATVQTTMLLPYFPISQLLTYHGS